MIIQLNILRTKFPFRYFFPQTLYFSPELRKKIQSTNPAFFRSETTNIEILPNK